MPVGIEGFFHLRLPLILCQVVTARLHYLLNELSSVRTRRPVSARALEILRQAVWASLEAAERVNALVWLPPFGSVGIARGEKDVNDS
jgi:hypothetical protein